MVDFECFGMMFCSSTCGSWQPFGVVFCSGKCYPSNSKTLVFYNSEFMENLGKSGLPQCNISEKDLHKKFISLGLQRRGLTNQLLAILPEIYERGIYKKYAATIVEYAGKFAGLSKSVVMKRLRIEKLLQGKPRLKELIASEGVHKVALVASLATSENEDIWADKVENMSKAALFELAKEVRSKRQMCGLFGDAQGNEKCQAAPQTIKITLEGELFFLFHKLKAQFGKNLTTTELLQKIFMESLEENKQTAQRSVLNSGCSKKAISKPKMSLKSIPGNAWSTKKKITRYNPVQIKRAKLAETKGKCSYPGCDRPCEVFHHTERIAEALAERRDAVMVKQSNIPICRIHHEFAHNGLIQNEKETSKDWVLELSRSTLLWVDQSYRKWRRLGLAL